MLVHSVLRNMISLPRQTTFAGLEQFLRDVRQAPGQDLRLPMQVSHGGAFSFSAVAVQCLATWARLHEGKRRIKLAPNFASDENTRSRVAGTLTKARHSISFTWLWHEWRPEPCRQDKP